MTLPDTLPTVEVDHLPGPDFTTYRRIKRKPKEHSHASSSVESSGGEIDPHGLQDETHTSRRAKKKKKRYSEEGSFEIKNGPDKTVARGLKCRSYGGAYWSITLRCDASNTREPSNRYLPKLGSGLRKYAKNHPNKTKPQDYLGYCPIGFDDYSQLFPKKKKKRKGSDPKAELFLNDIYQVCLQLSRILLANRPVTPTGLITITGATDSSKSLVTRGLIFLYLEAAAKEALKKKLRRPHLVTFEDPIEQYYIKDPSTNSAPMEIAELQNLLAAINIDYTPREKKVDAARLSTALRDAKRQTPAVFFVGETRDPGDWKELLQFAGSGHLVITTSHASSVVEAMTQIFRETGTKMPSQRSEIARRILGIVNLRSFHPTSENITSNVRVLLPAVWKSTSQSVNNLVADGLSSMLPALGREQEIGYYGRTFFARELIACCTPGFNECDDIDELGKEIKRKAMEWDIGGN